LLSFAEHSRFDSRQRDGYTMRLPTLLLAAAALAAATPAVALTSREEAELRRDCTGDYFNFCFPMKPYSPELAQCFHRSMGRLSYACRTSIQTFLRNNPDARTGSIRRP
jgi:hypothetical protein